MWKSNFSFRKRERERERKREKERERERGGPVYKGELEIEKSTQAYIHL